jgi:hypothetical protein
MPVRSIEEILRSLPKGELTQLEAPAYHAVPLYAMLTSTRIRIALAVDSMKYHTTDEGYQITAGLAHNGYQLCGHNILTSNYTDADIFIRRRPNLVDLEEILAFTDPSVVVVQDKREWHLSGPRDFRDPNAEFRRVYLLKNRPDIFKLTILKDAHHRPEYHRDSADEIGCHAWIIYYHPRIVSHLASYIRPNHLIRTYHTIDKDLVPNYHSTLSSREGCLISGAVSSVYPLRKSLIDNLSLLPKCDYLRHPGYHRKGCATPAYLKILSDYKVAICTSSIYGYALRKIIEATACGCIVLTDLPSDDILPYIDENLVRITPDFSPIRIGRILNEILRSYNPERQEKFSNLAKQYYDYRVIGKKLANDIEMMRRSYNG